MEESDDLNHSPGWIEACEAAYPKVYRAVVAMGATREEAADALQDAFERALRQRAPVARAESWLFVVAIRQWRRRRWRERLFRPLEHAAANGHGPSPESEAVDLVTELANLTERQRTVMVARYVLGLSQQETAAALGITAGTVAATTHQATTKMRERLGGTR